MPIPTVTQMLIAAFVAFVIAGSAYALRLLALSGAIAALLVGTALFGFGGLPFAIPLIAFFFSSSLLSKVGKRRKANAEAVYAKSSRRDAWQVLANGSVPAVLAVVFHRNGLLSTWMIALAALAAVNGDTWATEIGGLSKTKPRLLSNFKTVEAGTSGAVSPIGLAAALVGSLFIALVGMASWPPYNPVCSWRDNLPEILAITWAGFLATFADSILGAGVQAQYRCAECGAVTERRTHCSQPAKLERGLPWIGNDAVNLIAAILGAVFAHILLSYIRNPG